MTELAGIEQTWSYVKVTHLPDPSIHSSQPLVPPALQQCLTPSPLFLPDTSHNSCGCSRSLSGNKFHFGVRTVKANKQTELQGQISSLDGKQDGDTNLTCDFFLQIYDSS